jgi:FtsP/CotA-like multicopper oxidase with cupredoxin domain
MGQRLGTMGEQMGAMSNQLGSLAGPMNGAGGQMGSMNMDYNYFTINGKAYPAAESWTVKEGDKVRVRIVNISNLAHPMHLHGQDFKVIAKDGEPVPVANQQWMNTLNVAPGETYDIAFIADNPGNWVFHCHELHHTENNGVEPGGLIQVIKYEGYVGYQGSADLPAAMPESMPGMGH